MKEVAGKGGDAEGIYGSGNLKMLFYKHYIRTFELSHVLYARKNIIIQPTNFHGFGNQGLIDPIKMIFGRSQIQNYTFPMDSSPSP